MVLALVADLFFSVKIESAARSLGYSVQVIERAEQVAPTQCWPNRAS